MNQGFQSEFLSYVRSRSSVVSETVTVSGQQSAESTEVNGSSEDSVGEATSDANDDHWPDSLRGSHKIINSATSTDMKDMEVESEFKPDKMPVVVNRRPVSSTPPSSDSEKRQRRSRAVTPSSNVNSKTNGHSRAMNSGGSVENGEVADSKSKRGESKEREDGAEDSDEDDDEQSPPEPQLAHRPKRNIQPKTVESVAGLSWREENDLKKAIYASLQESRSRGKITPMEDHKTIPIRLRGHESHRTPTPSSGDDRKNGRRRPFSIDESSQDSTRSCVSSENSTDKDEFHIRARVHAQRKFAAGSRPGSPNASPSKPKPTPKKQFFTTKKAKTEDFLTFLCLRGSHVLPPHLDFYNMEDSDDNGYSYPTTPRQSQQSSRTGTPGNAHSPRSSRSRAVSPAPSKASSSDREVCIDGNDLGVNPLAGLGVDTKPSVVAGASTSSYSATSVSSTSPNCRRSHRPSSSPFSTSARMHGQAPSPTFRPPPFIGGPQRGRQSPRDARTRGNQWEPADESPQSSPKKSSSRKVSVNSTVSPNKRKSVETRANSAEGQKKSRLSNGREGMRNTSRSSSGGGLRVSPKSPTRAAIRQQMKNLDKIKDNRKATRRKLVMRAKNTVAKQRERQLQRTTRSSSNLGQNLEPGLLFNTKERIISSKKDSVKKVVHAEIHVPPRDSLHKHKVTAVKRKPTRPFNVRSRFSNKARANKRRMAMRLRAEARTKTESVDFEVFDPSGVEERKFTGLKESVEVKTEDKEKVKKEAVASTKPEKMKRPDRSPETRSQRAKAEAAALAAARHRSLLEEAAKQNKTEEQTTPTRTRRTLDLDSTPTHNTKPQISGQSPKVETPIQNHKSQTQAQTLKQQPTVPAAKVSNSAPSPRQQTPAQKLPDDAATPPRTRRSSLEEVSPRKRRTSVDDASPRTRRSSTEELSPRTRQAKLEDNVAGTTPRGHRLSVESRDSSRESTRTRRSLRDDSADKLSDGPASPVPDPVEKPSPSQNNLRTRMASKVLNAQPATSPQKQKTVARNQNLIPSFYPKPKRSNPSPTHFRKSPSPTKRTHDKIEISVPSRTSRPPMASNNCDIPVQKPPTIPKVAIRRPFPQPTEGGQLVEIPTYHPSPEQFQDPISYIASIRLDAEPYGMCRIIPPDGWKPECRIHDDLKFMTQVQYIHRLHHRWGPNALQLECIRKHLESQGLKLDQPPIVGGVELDLALLLDTVNRMDGMDQVIRKNKWTKLAETLHIPKVIPSMNPRSAYKDRHQAQERHMRLYDVYCKFLLSYAMLSPEEKQKLAEQVLADRGRKKGKPQEQVTCKGRTRQLGEFFKMARNVTNMWFKEGSVPTVKQVEAEYWRIVDEGKYHVTVQAAHIDCSQCGSGFPTRKDPAAHASPYPKHGWNFNNLQHNSGSVIRHLGVLNGISVPTLHISMIFGTSCWNRDQHLLPYIHYSHTGADISWYCIPPSEERKFQAAAKELAPDLVQDAPVWLTEDTLMMNPQHLIAKGVNIGHVVQQQGEFLIVFPRTFTATVSAGYNISESLHFATSHWLSVGVEAARMLNLSCIPEIFSMDRLLFKLALSEKSSSDVLRRVVPLLEAVIQEEVELRRQLAELGLNPTDKMPAEELVNVKSKRGTSMCLKDEHNKCDVSGKICYLSMVVNEPEDCVFSLKNAIVHLQKKKNLKMCKLCYRYDEAEMWAVLQRVKHRLASGSTPPKKKSKHKRHHTVA